MRTVSLSQPHRVDVRARDCQESQEERLAKSERPKLGSYVRHVWVLDYIYIPMPSPVHPVNPGGRCANTCL